MSQMLPPRCIPRAPCWIPRVPCWISRAPCCIPRAPCWIPRAPCCIPRAPCWIPRAPCCIPRAPCNTMHRFTSHFMNSITHIQLNLRFLFWRYMYTKPPWTLWSFLRNLICLIAVHYSLMREAWRASLSARILPSWTDAFDAIKSPFNSEHLTWLPS